MTAAVRFLFAVIASASAAAAIAAASPDAIAWPRGGFPPDLKILLTLGRNSIPSAALAGGITGAAIFVTLASRRESPGLAALFFALFNPLVLLVHSFGAEASLALAGTLLLIRAVVGLGVERDHGSTVELALAAAAAPLISNSVLLLYPFICVFAPGLSPWGAAPGRLVGFLAVTFTPFAMMCGALLYLHWLLDSPGISDVMLPRVPIGPLLVVLLAATLLAVGGRMRSSLALAGAFIGGCALLLVALADLAPVAGLARMVR